MQGSYPWEGWEKAALSQKQQVLRNKAACTGVFRLPVICPASLVSRFRSSYHYAAYSFSNFGIERTLGS